jgi:hypothetical protein
MNFTRGSLVLGAALSLLGGVLCLFPGTAARLGLDLWNLPELGLELQRDEAYGTELDREAEETFRREVTKEEVVPEVLAGRLTLWQAAARFRALDATASPRIRKSLGEGFPGIAEDERCCRKVITWVARREAERPDGGHGVAQRLAAELEDALRHGRLSLPDPALAGYGDQEHTPP